MLRHQSDPADLGGAAGERAAPAKGSRGAYHAVFSMLFDDPDYQRLPSRARLVLLTARLCKDAGPAVIFRYYPEILAHQTSSTTKQVKADLKVLAAGGWIVYDDDVLWVRNGLRYDPTITLANPNHLAAVRKSLSRLPKSPVVLKFCDYYKIEYPSGWHLDPIAIREKGEGEKGEGKEPLSGNGARPGVPNEAEAREVLDYLNHRTGRHYEPVEANLRLIRARLAEPGRTVEQMCAVIDAKTAEWLTDQEMGKYLRPSTLFNHEKFAQYVGNLSQKPAELKPETPEERYARQRYLLTGETTTPAQAMAHIKRTTAMPKHQLKESA